MNNTKIKEYSLNSNCISTIDHLSAFVQNLSSGSLSQKYFYFNSYCAYNWIKLVEDRNNYKLSHQSYTLLQECFNEILNIIQEQNNESISYVSLGVGDGKDDCYILDKLLDSKYNRIDYYLYDISFDLISYTLNHITSSLSKNIDKIANIKIFNSDFEFIQGFSKDFKSDTNPKLFSMLGSTISNFNETWLMKKIINVMSIGDYLLLSVDCALDKIGLNALQSNSTSSSKGKEFLRGPLNYALLLASNLNFKQLPSSNILKEIKEFQKRITDIQISSEVIEGDLSNMSKYGDCCTVSYNIQSFDHINMLNFSHKYKTDTVSRFFISLGLELVYELQGYSKPEIVLSTDVCSCSIFLLRKTEQDNSLHKMKHCEINRIRGLFPEEEQSIIRVDILIDKLKEIELSRSDISTLLALKNSTELISHIKGNPLLMSVYEECKKDIY